MGGGDKTSEISWTYLNCREIGATPELRKVNFLTLTQFIYYKIITLFVLDCAFIFVTG